MLAASASRLRTGEGQHIDTSLLEAGIALSVWEAAEYWSGRGIPQPMGSAHRMSGPYQAVRCADGYITLGAASQRTWERLCQALERSELNPRPEFAPDGAPGRLRHELGPLNECKQRTEPMENRLVV